MTYNNGIAVHQAKVKTRYRNVFIGMTLDVERSIKEGSPVTGAPGQPRDTSNLFHSWIPRFLSQYVWQLATNVSYAQFVEDNVNGVTFQNHGPHSVKLTIAGADKLLDAVVKRTDA